jgi:hypothetical protein
MEAERKLPVLEVLKLCYFDDWREQDVQQLVPPPARLRREGLGVRDRRTLMEMAAVMSCG